MGEQKTTPDVWRDVEGLGLQEWAGRKANSSTTAFERITDWLRSDGRKVTERGDSARAKCPGHDGHSDDSLSVRRVTDSALIHCHGGCPTEDVLAAMGMTKADLYDCPKTAYDYEDVHGRSIRTVTRSFDAGGKKTFRQSGDTKRYTLFRLPEVIRAVANGGTVYLVEGESDVIALESLGVVATTGPQGAQSFGKVDVAPLEGANVVAIVDADDAGDGWAELVQQRLEGVAGDLTFVKAATGKDARDHVSAGLGVGDFRPYGQFEPTVLTMSDVQPERVEWLWRGRLPVGKLVTIEGDPGTGKSTLTLDMAARLSTGTPWPDGAPCRKGRTLLLSAEDQAGDTIAPRLMAAGADLSQVTILVDVPMGGQRVPPVLPRDLHHIERIIRRERIDLVVVDVLMAYLDGKVDSYRDQDVRAVLHRVAKIAERTSSTWVLIRHFNKQTGGKAIHRGSGSVGITGAARATFMVGTDPEDDDLRVFAYLKVNLAPPPPSLAYRLEVSPEHDCSRIRWEGVSSLTSHDLSASTVSGDEAIERDEAAMWLEEFMMEKGPSVLARDALKAGQGAGISNAALKRAKKKLGVTSSKGRGGIDAGWFWTFDPDPAGDRIEQNCEGVTKGSKGSLPVDPAPSTPSQKVPISEDKKMRAVSDISSLNCDTCGRDPAGDRIEQNCEGVTKGSKGSLPVDPAPSTPSQKVPISEDKKMRAVSDVSSLNCDTCGRRLGKAEVPKGTCTQCRRIAAANAKARTT